MWLVNKTLWRVVGPHVVKLTELAVALLKGLFNMSVTTIEWVTVYWWYKVYIYFSSSFVRKCTMRKIKCYFIYLCFTDTDHKLLTNGKKW